MKTKPRTRGWNVILIQAAGFVQGRVKMENTSRPSQVGSFIPL